MLLFITFLHSLTKLFLFTMQAIAVEQGVPSPKSASVEITVNVQDKNDNAPKFPASGYSATIKEGRSRRRVTKVTKYILCNLTDMQYI